MKTSEGETPPPILSYADNETWRGISIMRDEGMLRLIVPPIASWKHLRKSTILLATALAIVVVYLTHKTYVVRDLMSIFPLAEFALILFAVLVAALYRMNRRLIFDVTDDALAMTEVVPFLSPSRSVWPRNTIGEVKLNSSDGKLLIRITGSDRVEINVSRDPKMVDWVVRTLFAELQRPRAAKKSIIASQEPKSDSAEQVQTATVRRRAGVFAFVMMVVFGVLLIACGFPYEIFGVYFLLFSCVPIGIALGTHEREYYL